MPCYLLQENCSDPFFYACPHLSGGALGALALVLFQVALAQADRLRGDLGELVLADELHRVLERERDRRGEADGPGPAGGGGCGGAVGRCSVYPPAVGPGGGAGGVSPPPRNPAG